MQTWECAMRGDGRSSCPHPGEDSFEVSLAPCLYDNYPSEYNYIGGGLTVDEPDEASLNTVSIICGVLALVVWIIGAIRLRKDVRKRNKLIIGVLIYVPIVGIASIIGGAVLQSRLKDSSDIVCRGYTSYLGEQDGNCAVGYSCNGNKLEADNEDLEIVFVLFCLASVALSFLFGAAFLAGIIVGDICECDCLMLNTD